MRSSQLHAGLLLALAVVPLVVGCAQAPRIDASGERLLAWDTPAAGPIVTGPVVTAPVVVSPGAAVVAAPVTGVPTLGQPIFAQPGLTLTPTRIVAPVGTEVLMVAGVHGAGDPLVTGQRVEWMMAPGSVGTFLAVGEREGPNFLRWFGTPPQKVSNDYAVTETVSVARVITRGTIDPADDVSVLPGQAWVTLSSPIEGSSHVTAFAPELLGTTGNRQSGAIHWVDARWNAPPPATVPAGTSHALTTAVVRHSTGMPAAGYKVRYEVVSGPAAGFGPSASGGVELTTDGQGMATAELVQRSAQAGVTEVSVQLIRPAGIVPGSELLVLGSTTTRVTWVEAGAAVAAPAISGDVLTPSPGVITPTPMPITPTPTTPTRPSVPTPVGPPLEVRITGPERATVSEQVQFQIDITNRTAAAIDKLIVVDRFDAGLRHAKDDRQIQRDIGAIGAGQTRSIQVIFNVVAPGRQCHTVEISGSGNERASANACLNAAEAPVAETPSIRLERTAPRQMRVDEKAIFQISIINTGSVAISGLRVVETWQRGLNPVQASPEFKKTRDGIVAEIERPLAPGETTTLQVEYIATDVVPRACAQATVSGGRDLAQVDEVCVDIGPPSPSDAAAGKLTLALSDRADPVRVEQVYSYRLVIRNDGPTPQRNVVLRVNLPDGVLLESINRPQDQFKVAGGMITFNPILEMPPGDALSYDIQVKALRPGAVQAEATVISQSITQPITALQSTEILGR